MNSFFVRRYVISGIFITIILILAAKLYYIQLVDKHYLIYATKNVVRSIKQYPARGAIYDRNGRVLVQNEAFYDIMVIPRQVKPFDTLEFCKLFNIDKAEFKKRLTKAIRYSPNLASVFEKQLSAEAYAPIEERLSEFPGFFSTTRYLRTYPDSVAAQFLGYIGEVTDRDIKRSGGYYQPGDYIGVTGVERAYENVLRGQVGVKNMVVDSHNKLIGSYDNGALDTPARPGERLTSSLDIRIQKLGEQLMHNKVGSIVAIEPSTGEILCFVSSPTYDPNLMVGRQRGNNAAKLYKDPYDPFLIRPIQAYYPPGSSFKPCEALIALQEHLITPQMTYDCTGVYWAGNHPVHCDEVHGITNLTHGIAMSCNGYFCTVFTKTMLQNGLSNMHQTYSDWKADINKFGFGEKLGVDLPNERSGFMPSAGYYDEKFGNTRWQPSSIISIGFGQGELEATPLQLANIECTIANHGYYYTPHLIKSIGDKKIIDPKFLVKHYVGIDPQYFEPVIDGMQQVVESGTAASSKIPGIIMCGKTGTAQNPHGKNHSIFVAFAPRDHPKIAIAVVVENAGQGAWWAAPIASYIVEKYLTDTIARPKEEFERIMNANLLPDTSTYIVRPQKKPSKNAVHLKTKRPEMKSVALKERTGNKVALLTTTIKAKENE